MQAGVSFRHDTGGSGRHYMPETMGPGCAVFDYDGDDRPDLLLLQGAPLPGRPPSPGAGNRLFRNAGDGRFEEVPDAAGLMDGGYAMGCSAADIDNDGDVDVFLTRFGGNRLYRNDGGRFKDITRAAGVAGGGWSAGAAFGDYDGDGLLDLYVARYLAYDPETAVGCRAPDGSPGYCPPETYPAMTGLLYRNRGNGVFQDVSAAAGISRVKSRGMGVVWTDYDRDGRPDIFVACDRSPNVLWHNLGGGKFEDVGVRLGVAFDDGGRILNGMGVDAADTDHDGDMEFFVTNFAGQPNGYYEHLGKAGFRFRSAESGLGAPSVRPLGFGCHFFDFDNDGWEDVFVANGHVDDKISQSVPDLTHAQPCLLFRNDRTGHFAVVPAVEGQGIWRSRVSRGSALLDFDGDGGVDILVANCGDRVELFRNQAARGNWLRVRLEGRKSNRSAVGARIELTVGGTIQTREVRAGSGYLSQSELAQTFGLGAATRAERVRVVWPSGRVSVSRGVPAGQVLRLREPA